MKNTGLIITMTLALLIAGGSVTSAQRGMRGHMPDSLRMGRPGNQGMQMRHMDVPPDFMRMHMMAHMKMAMNNLRMMPPMHRPRPGFGPQAQGHKRFEMIPNLTEKQKKDIADLKKQQQSEMQKFREETTARLKEMKESHRKKVMSLLTDEQKKFLEEKKQVPPPPPAPQARKK